jgi:lipopolysaccharide transport system permease protein
MNALNLHANWKAGWELFGLLKRHRQLTWDMTRRELTERYAGQILGVLWAIVHPGIQIAVYVFIFAYVFGVKMGGTSDLPRDYTTYLLAGLIPWLMCADAMAKGSVVLVSNANLVKQVVFPLEVLPVKSVLATAFTQVVSSAFLLIYSAIVNGGLPWTCILLPILMTLQVLFLVGLCSILAAIGAGFRDLRELIQVLTVIGIYLMPIVYLPSMVPLLIQRALYANPFSYLIWCYQDALYFGRFQHPVAWIVFFLTSLLTFALGYRAFRKLKPMFGNVL